MDYHDPLGILSEPGIEDNGNGRRLGGDERIDSLGHLAQTVGNIGNG
jgi:hypothetical protein